MSVAGPSSTDTDDSVVSSNGSAKKQEISEPVTSSNRLEPEQKQATTLCVYVNNSCECGPFLDPIKVNDLPSRYGPTSLNRVLKSSVQSLVDAGKDPKKVFELIQQEEGDGKVTISATFDSKILTLRLPVVKNSDDYWNFIEILLDKLSCCENFYSKEQLDKKCEKCYKPEKGEVITEVKEG